MSVSRFPNASESALTQVLDLVDNLPSGSLDPAQQANAEMIICAYALAMIETLLMNSPLQTAIGQFDPIVVMQINAILDSCR